MESRCTNLLAVKSHVSIIYHILSQQTRANDLPNINVSLYQIRIPNGRIDKEPRASAYLRSNNSGDVNFSSRTIDTRWSLRVSRIWRQILPPSARPPQSLSSHPLQQWHTVSSQSDLQEAFCWMPYKGLPFLTRRFRGYPYMSADSGQCPLSDVAPLFLSSTAVSFCNVNVYGNTPARARSGVPWSHLDGMSRAVRLKEERTRFILRLCTSTSFSSSVAYPRTPLPFFADFRE